MIHKASASVTLLVLLGLFAPDARAERRMVQVTDSSSSGKLVRVNVGLNSGMRAGEPVLFSAGSKKVAAGRVFRADEFSSIVVVLEKYGPESPIVEADYELLFGEPFPEAANLPNYVTDREEEEDNPANERFFEDKSEETTPELDDDNYTPEVSLRPKLPEPRTYSPHNITVGVGLFRNRTLPSTTTTNAGDPSQSSYSMYQGYTVRYAYTFRTHYWLKSSTAGLVSVEGSFGIYNFSHTLSAGANPVSVRVIPLGLNLRYLIEVSKLLRLYPYAGFQYNVVGATMGTTRAGATSNTGDLGRLENIRGSQLFGGAGAQLVMSNALDARVQGGTDGVLAGVVVKF